MDIPVVVALIFLQISFLFINFCLAELNFLCSCSDFEKSCCVCLWGKVQFVGEIGVHFIFGSIRIFPTLLVVELQRHRVGVNAIAWAPHSSCHICTVGDDSQALIWDLLSMGQPVEDGLVPIVAYTAGAKFEQLQWSSSQPDWVAIAFLNKLQILRV